jgi:PKD repeat protein
VINVANSCIKDLINFTDGSTLPSTPFPTSIVSWRWDFDDQSFSNIQSPNHGYIVPREYDVDLTATTQQGCSHTTTQTIRVGDVPTVDFEWSEICSRESTRFKNLSSSSFSSIDNFEWDFGDGNIISGAPGVPVGSASTSGTFDFPNHQYGSFDDYNVKLTIHTNDGCINSLQQKVFILPDTALVELQAGQNYLANFEANDGGWQPESLWKKSGSVNPKDSVRFSWEWSAPNGVRINSAASGTHAWWTGRRVTIDPFGTNNVRYINPDSYFTSESSAVNGPCFDLTGLERPMVTLDYWIDSEEDRDGAVLQYSINGGLDWFVVGALPGQDEQGINWYNSLFLPGNPGNQGGASLGWSYSGTDWVNARFNLDMIDPAARSQVRLRVAFGSEDSNRGSATFDGFAFDNFFVGEKTRNVLVEHFTNSDPAYVVGDLYLNALFQDQVNLRSAYGGKSDFQDIQYHLSIPTTDPLNTDNPVDPAARSLYMGVSRPPFTIMDGIVNSTFTGSYLSIKQIEIDRRALSDPLFNITLDTVTLNPATITNSTTRIYPVLSVTANAAFTRPLLVQVALVEDVGSNRNVVRKLLFGPDGMTWNNPWVAGQNFTIHNDVIDINVPIVDPGRLKLVAWVQDKGTKEIFQSATIVAPRKIGALPVGLVDEGVVQTTLNGIVIYPNPANSKFNFGLPSEDNNGFTWKVSDQRGVIVRSGTFDNAIGNKVEVDVAGLPNAMYIVHITGPGKSTVYHKLVIMNHP